MNVCYLLLVQRQLMAIGAAGAHGVPVTPT